MKNTLFLVLGLFLVSCKKDKPLTIEKTPYLGSEIRVDGYYFSSALDDEGVQRYSIIVLYRDGVVLFPGFEKDHTASLTDIEAEIANGNVYANSVGRKSCWGIFLVEGDTLVTETWAPVLFGGMRPIKSRAVILNDSTFSVQSSEEKGGLPERTYYFKEFSPKPDSSNTFV